MKNQYQTYDYNTLTEDVLNSIEVGDLIKCNDWKTSLRVKAVSEHYFVMSRNCFGRCLYSVCEKIRSGYTRNLFNEDFFRIGTDNYIFGHYNYLDSNDCQAALEDFEKGLTTNIGCEPSVRRAVNLWRISIKKDKKSKSNS